MTSDPVSVPAPKTVDRWLAQMRFARVQPYIPRGARLLDVGAGDGSFLRTLSGYVSTGVGIDPLITAPVSFDNCQLVSGYFPQDFDRDCQFDVITLLATIEHIPSDMLSDVEASCWKYLAAGGRVIITVPHPFVDKILDVLKFFRIINGMATEEHYGFNPIVLPGYFCRWQLVEKQRWQLGCNYLFVFQKFTPDKHRVDTLFSPH